MADDGQQIGRLLLVQIGDGASPETFSNLCGINTSSFTMSANDVDTTIPNCESPEDTPQKTGTAGILQRQFQGSGKFVKSANTTAFIGYVAAGTTFNAKVTVPGYGTFTGPWYVTNFEFSGQQEGNMDFSATFVAAGLLTFESEDA